MTTRSVVVDTLDVSGAGGGDALLTSAALASAVLVLSLQAPATNAAIRQTASAPSMRVPGGVVSFGVRVNGFRMGFSW